MSLLRTILDRIPKKTSFITGQEQEKIRQGLNALKFPNCEDVLVGDVLYYPTAFTNIASSPLRLLRIIRLWLSMVKTILFSGYIYQTGKTNNSALFLFSSQFSHRADHESAFLKLRNMF